MVMSAVLGIGSDAFRVPDHCDGAPGVRRRGPVPMTGRPLGHMAHGRVRVAES